MNKPNEISFAPVRSLDDFLLQSARFQVPTLQDADKWANRVINNLLYYQTNYMIIILLIFLFVGILNPVQMLIGIACVSTAFVLFVYFSNNQDVINRLKKKTPALFTAIIFFIGFVLIYLIGSVITFLFGIAAPLLLVLLHASVRLRNIKNKLANQTEFIGGKRTIMGYILESVGYDSAIAI